MSNKFAWQDISCIGCRETITIKTKAQSRKVKANMGVIYCTDCKQAGKARFKTINDIKQAIAEV